jgi:DNA-binding HxlR family transcriptional regulator
MSSQRINTECPIARTAAVAGDHWRLLILRDVLSGYRRFDELRADLGIASNILTQRLQVLVDDGFLERRPYALHPRRDEYWPTPMAQDFRIVLAAMVQFGTAWLSPRGATVALVSGRRDTPVKISPRDAHTGRERAWSSVRMVAGPAASHALRARLETLRLRAKEMSE